MINIGDPFSENRTGAKAIERVRLHTKEIS
jgi:hypothetical protein